MTRWAMLFVVLALAACEKSKSGEPKAGEPAPAAAGSGSVAGVIPEVVPPVVTADAAVVAVAPVVVDAAPALNETDGIIAGLKGFADQMCACKDEACAKKVHAAQREWENAAEDAWEAAHGKDVEPPADVLKQFEDQSERMRVCHDALDGDDGIGGDKPPAEAVVAGSTGLPACDEVIAMYERLGRCDKLPESARNAMIQGGQSMRESWGDFSLLDEATRKAINEGCEASIAPMKQTVDDNGC